MHVSKGENDMINYDPFWKTLSESKESWYTLIHKHEISSSTLHRLKHNMYVTTATIETLCRILHCSVGDIMEYTPEE